MWYLRLPKTNLWGRFDYLLKPIEAEELQECVGKLSEKKRKNDLEEQLGFMPSMLAREQ